MLGNMQQHTLGVAALIDFADCNHGDAENVSRRMEGDIHRTDWRRIASRTRRIARWLAACQLGQGQRVATIAWNGYRHLELYYGVSASGRGLHTLNPRLAPAQLAWIINDAQDRVVCFGATFLALVQAGRAMCPGVAHWVLMSDADRMPYIGSGMTRRTASASCARQAVAASR